MDNPLLVNANTHAAVCLPDVKQITCRVENVNIAGHALQQDVTAASPLDRLEMGTGKVGHMPRNDIW